MIITRLRLENWRNFKHVETPLQRRVFIAGPNASGKSNFLDAIRFLRDIAASGGGLQHSVVALRNGVSKLRCLAARRYPDITIEVELGESSAEAQWTYRLTFKQDNQRRPIVVNEVVTKNGDTLLDRPDRNDERDPERLIQTYLEQVNTNQPFREIAAFFTSIRYFHIVPQLVRDPERYIARTHDPFGGDFLEQLASAPERIRKPRLEKINSALRIAVPQLISLSLERDPVRGTPHLEGRFKHWRVHGARQQEDQFSDGTLRLLGLLWTVLDGSGPLLLEEPELSLHPAVVRFIPQMLARVTRKSARQVILSTHSPELLSDKGIAPDEILLLTPTPDGTQVKRLSDDRTALRLLSHGEAPGDIVMPKVAPRRAEQLALFE